MLAFELWSLAAGRISSLLVLRLPLNFLIETGAPLAAALVLLGSDFTM